MRILCLNSNTGKDQIRNHSNYSINNKPLALSENLEQGNTRFLQLKTTHPTVVDDNNDHTFLKCAINQQRNGRRNRES